MKIKLIFLIILSVIFVGNNKLFAQLENDQLKSDYDQLKKENLKLTIERDQLKKENALLTKKFTQLKNIDDALELTKRLQEVIDSLNFKIMSLESKFYSMRKETNNSFDKMSYQINDYKKIQNKFIWDSTNQKQPFSKYYSDLYELDVVDSLYSIKYINNNFFKKNDFDNFLVYNSSKVKSKKQLEYKENYLKFRQYYLNNKSDTANSHLLIDTKDINLNPYSPCFVNIFFTYTESLGSLSSKTYDGISDNGKFGWGIDMNLFLYEQIYLNLDYSSINSRNWFGLNSKTSMPSYSVGGFGLNWMPKTYWGVGCGYFWGGINKNQFTFYKGLKAKVDYYYDEQYYFNLSFFLPTDMSVIESPRFRTGIGIKFDLNSLKHTYFY